MANSPFTNAPPPPHDPSVPFRGAAKPVKKGKPAKGKPTDFHMPVPTAVGTANGPHPPSPSPAAGSDAALIQQMIAAMQLPQTQAIQNAQAASIMAARNSATSTQGYYQALAGILQGIGPATQQGYQSAAGADSAFGKGFANGLAQVQDQAGAQTNDALSVAGAPAAQGAQATAALGGAGATDALYGLGGYIPASTMNREGAAFGAAANLLPVTTAGQGAQAIKQIGEQQRVDQQGFAKQYADLAAQVPGLALQINQQLASQHATQQAEKDRVSAAGAHEADVKKQQQISYIIATGTDPQGNLTPKARSELAAALGYDPVTHLPTAATLAKQATVANADARLTLAQQKQLSDLYGVDANGNLTLAGRKAALAQWKAEHPAKKGGLTDAARARLQDQAAKLADRFYYGTPDVTTTSGVKPGIPAVADYQKALKLVLSHGIPLEYALKALNALYPIGQEGRPWVDVAGRWLLQQAGMPMTNPEGMPTVAQAKWLNAHGYSYGGPVHDVNPNNNPNAAGPPH